MKKFITLLLLAGAVSGTAFSQTPQEESRRVILGKGGSKTGTGTSDPREVILGRDGRNNETGNPSGTRDQQVNQVNREYNAKIQSIRNNPTLSAAEKERMIRQLENDRQRKINEINRRYNDGNRNRNDRDRDDRDRDDDDRKNKKYGKNNNPGKKLGWEKGVGNPHRTGSDKNVGNKNKGREFGLNTAANAKGQAKGKGNKGRGKRD
jgi:hypothetical protein